MRKTKSILYTSDRHAGHHTGLTPPDWWFPEKCDTPWRQKIADYQRWSWGEYCDCVSEMGTVDYHIDTGDCIDGKGTKSGSTELTEAGRDEQCNMAVVGFKEVKCRKRLITRGTPYHAGASEDWENQVAKDLGAEIKDHAFLDVNGVGISARHYVGGTQNPKSKATSLLGAQISNDQWKREYEEHPDARIFLRGHVHRNIVVDEPSTLSIIAPCLQGWTKFGSKICGLPVHFGVMLIEITPAGNWSWKRKTVKLGKQVQVIKW